MFTSKQLENYADALIWGVSKNKKGGPFEEGSIFLVRTDLAGLPLAEATFKKLLEMGHHPLVDILSTENQEVMFYDIANDRQLDFLYPWWKEKYQHVRGNIYINAPMSLTHLKDVPPEKPQRRARALKEFRKFLDSQEEKGLFSWTLCTYPTEELADKAGLSLWDYRDQIIKACYLDMNNTANDLESANKMIEDICEWLNELPIDKLHLEATETDLTVTVGERRQWLGGGGANIPSFEVFTSPDCRHTEGTYYANLPSYWGGKLVEGVRLTFKEGRVIKATADRSEDFLNKYIETDEGSNAVGEFSLTDIRLSKIDKFMADVLFDENFGGENGNSHIAVGCSYTETFDGNPADLTDEAKKELGFNDSVTHWDLVNTTEKRVTAVLKDGSKHVIYENGMFKY